MVGTGAHVTPRTPLLRPVGAERTWHRGPPKKCVQTDDETALAVQELLAARWAIAPADGTI
ncbi:DUF6207 family protein [Streptomyces afghaniensis]|uniref:DUF6207 family protein n=1 Tax=Streptomyces afghaniensis TaxID=66865 RepID=UPI0033A0BF37